MANGLFFKLKDQIHILGTRGEGSKDTATTYILATVVFFLCSFIVASLSLKPSHRVSALVYVVCDTLFVGLIIERESLQR